MEKIAISRTTADTLIETLHRYLADLDDGLADGTYEDDDIPARLALIELEAAIKSNC